MQVAVVGVMVTTPAVKGITDNGIPVTYGKNKVLTWAVETTEGRMMKTLVRMKVKDKTNGS